MSNFTDFISGGSSIKSIQKITGSGSSSASVTISAVDTSKTFVIWQGGGRADNSTYYSRISSVSSTSIGFYWGGGYTTGVSATVVEFN